MAKQVKHIRGTTSECKVYVGQKAELVYDEDLRTARMMDGVTPGGHPLVRDPYVVPFEVSEVLPQFGAGSREYVDAAFGVTSSLVADRSGLFQKIIDRISSEGGGTLRVASKELLFLYPVFIPSNITVDLGGGHHRTHIHTLSGSQDHPLYPTFVFGDSREFNRATTDAERAAGTFGPFENTSFEDIPLKNGSTPLFPEVDDPVYGIGGSGSAKIVAQNSRILGGRLTGPSVSTGRAYGVWYGNCANCHWVDGVASYMTQPVSIGSDVTPSTPYAVDCTLQGLFVEKPHPNMTYYLGGFMGHARRCAIRGVRSHVGIDPAQANGAGLWGNYLRYCEFSDFDMTIGRSATSEGVGFQNSAGSRAFNGVIRDAKKAISTFFSDTDFIDPDRPDFYRDIIHFDCDVGINTLGKYGVYSNIHGNALTDINFQNVNATDNTFYYCDNAVITVPAGQDDSWAIRYNRLEAFTPKNATQFSSKYLSPRAVISPVNAGDVTAHNHNHVVLGAKTGDVLFEVNLTADMSCQYLDRISFYMTYGAGSLTAGSAVSVKVFQRAAYSGNINEVHTEIYSYTVPAPASDAVQDVTVDLQLTQLLSGPWAAAWKATPGNPVGDIWVEITWTNPAANSYMKTIRAAGRFV